MYIPQNDPPLTVERFLATTWLYFTMKSEAGTTFDIQAVSGYAT